ncbi:MAG: hypothetical protein QGG42_18830 [Phycisphaerae bacterium]|nr:hypothetical protein [Phycisphaerae bacterium]
MGSIRALLGILLVAALVVAVLLVLAGVLWFLLPLPIDVGLGTFAYLDEGGTYPGWLNVSLAILVGTFVGVFWVGLWAGILFGVFVFILMLFDKPLVALATVGLLVIWVVSLVAGLASAVMAPPTVPGVGGDWKWILTVVFVILGIAGAIKQAGEAFESGGLKGSLDGLGDDNSIRMPGVYQNRFESGVKHRGEGFVILDK